MKPRLIYFSEPIKMHKIIPLLLTIIISGAAWANPQIEKAVRLFNQKEYQAAQTILQQEADKGSAHATYWLGGSAV